MRCVGLGVSDMKNCCESALYESSSRAVADGLKQGCKAESSLGVNGLPLRVRFTYVVLGAETCASMADQRTACARGIGSPWVIPLTQDNNPIPHPLNHALDIYAQQSSISIPTAVLITQYHRPPAPKPSVRRDQSFNLLSRCVDPIKKITYYVFIG